MYVGLYLSIKNLASVASLYVPTVRLKVYNPANNFFSDIDLLHLKSRVHRYHALLSFFAVRFSMLSHFEVSNGTETMYAQAHHVPVFKNDVIRLWVILILDKCLQNKSLEG